MIQVGTKALLVGALVLSFNRPLAAEEKPDIIAKSPDGKQTAAATGKVITLSYESANACKLSSHRDKVTVLVFSPDGKVLASGGRDKAVCLYDVASGKQTVQLECSSGIVSIIFDANGEAITVGLSDKTESRFEVKTGKRLGR